jgi:predicted  nucleic acid-binding Zn-ribbon protein
MEKNKIADQTKDAQIESAQRKRIELEGQIVNLNNQIERQKAEQQKAVSKHSDYEKQIFSLKS